MILKGIICLTLTLSLGGSYLTKHSKKTVLWQQYIKQQKGGHHNLKNVLIIETERESGGRAEIKDL